MPYKDPEKQRKAQRDWARRNKESVYSRNRAWKRENRERHNEHTRNRYHRMGGDGYRRHLSDLMEDYAGMCGICGEDMFGETDPIHVDHIIPVSKGGTNEYENLQPAHSRCNLVKAAA